ncbi:MAG: primosomal protein N', partial [Sulfurimonas sp.]|nr:primosomal protein N' [Sulfurimonas sp.]
MNYYKISLISSPLEALTYCSDKDIKIGAIVEVVLNNRELKGVVIGLCQEPEFKTLEVLGVSEFFYSQKQMELARFISIYYVCSLGDVFALMVAFQDKGEGKPSRPNSINGIDGLMVDFEDKGEGKPSRPKNDVVQIKYGTDGLMVAFEDKGEGKPSRPNSI